MNILSEEIWQPLNVHSTFLYGKKEWTDPSTLNAFLALTTEIITYPTIIIFHFFEFLTKIQEQNIPDSAHKADILMKFPQHIIIDYLLSSSFYRQYFIRYDRILCEASSFRRWKEVIILGKIAAIAYGAGAPSLKHPFIPENKGGF